MSEMQPPSVVRVRAAKVRLKADRLLGRPSDPRIMQIAAAEPNGTNGSDNGSNSA